MAGISSRAVGAGGNDASCGCRNKRGFNGNEIQNKEFSDASGLEVYDFNARTYDQQIGRFNQIDPLADQEGQESLTPYHFTGNNPVRYNDPDGKCPWCVPFIFGFVTDVVMQSVAVAAGVQTEINWGSAVVSGVGAMIGVPAGNLLGKIGGKLAGKIGNEVGEVVADAAINMGQQAVIDGKVDVTDAFINAGVGKVAGDFMGSKTETSVKSSSEYKTMDKQIDRADRVNNQNPRASRQENIMDMKTKQEGYVNNRKVAASTSASGVATGTLNIVKKLITGNSPSTSKSNGSSKGTQSYIEPPVTLPSPSKFVPVGRQGGTLFLQPNGSYR